MSDRIGQLTARLQAHGIDFRSAGGGRTVGALEPLDVAAAFGFIKVPDNQVIASYYYSVGNDRHGAVDVLYLILAREKHRQQVALANLLWRHCGGIDQDRTEQKHKALLFDCWPSEARNEAGNVDLWVRLREIAEICIHESIGERLWSSEFADALGMGKSAYGEQWAQVVSFARAEIESAIAKADEDILNALKN